MDQPPQQGHHIEDASENIEIIHSTLQVLASSAGFDIEEIWDERKVRNCLEAMGGVVDAATEMYWDDFLARLPPPRNARPNNNDAASEDSDMDDGVLVGQEQQPPPPPFQPAGFVVPQIQNNDDSGDDSSPEHVGSIGLAANLQRSLLLNKNRRVRRSRRRTSSSEFEDELVISDDEAIIEDRKKKAAKRKEISPRYKRQKIDLSEDVVSWDDDKDGYISDKDWLWTLMKRKKDDKNKTPNKFLWGESQDKVPSPWVKAGIKVSKLGGVFVQAPRDGDFGHSKWKDSSVQGIPAPYHCRSITVVNSLITALLYTGVGVQPGPCIAVGQQPLVEMVDKLDDMNPNEIRKRLVDALTTLLYIAATSSTERKRKALESMLSAKDPRWQKIQQKLKLVPTFTVPPSSDEISYKVSYSNIQDLKSYVDSSIDSFTGSRGVVMLLDLIVFIHGVSALRRMSSIDTDSIINCTCCKRFVPSEKADLQKLKSRAKVSPKLDTTPRDLSCISRSTDLFSLLVTGKFNATPSELEEAFKLLGFGVISEDTELPSNRTAKVWLVRGPTQWSILLWESGDFLNSDPVAKFRHLSLWYGDNNITRIQLSMRGTPDTFTSNDSTPIPHGEDKNYYPNKYRLWRFKFGDDDEWCSYHLLKPIQQRAIENSVGPRLAVLLRRQWPGVTIDDMSQNDPIV